MPTQIEVEIDVYGDPAPSFVTVKFWATEFKRDRTSLIVATTIDNIEKVRQMVLDDHRINVREIVEDVSISK